MKSKKTKLSQSFQRWLIVLVAVAFLATTVFLWMIQTQLSISNAISLLELNLSDVREDIIDASDANLLRLTRQVAADLNKMEGITNADLRALMTHYDVTEINVIDQHGVIVATTYPDFMGYDMRGGEQSAEFIVCQVDFGLSVCAQLTNTLHRIFLDDVVAFKVVEEHPQVANVVVDRDGADRFSEVPPPFRVVYCLLLIVGIEGVFAPLLEVKNVSAYHILIDLIHGTDTLFFFAPFLK